MSTINLGLQCVGLMREKMDDEFEEAHRCNSLKDLRAAAVRNPNFSTICDSMSHPKVLLYQIIQRLTLKEEPFTVFNAASSEIIEELWYALQSIDPTLSSSDKLNQKSLSSKPELNGLWTTAVLHTSTLSK